MTREEWTDLMRLNDRLTQAYAVIMSDVQSMERISGLSANEAMDALEHFSLAMAKITDVLNERLKEDQDTYQRQQEVEDVIGKVNRQLRKKRYHEEFGKDNQKPS